MTQILNFPILRHLFMGGGESASNSRIARHARETLEIDPFIRRGALALRLPQHFTQTFHDPVLGRMLIRELFKQFPIITADAFRLIDRQLLLDGNMHTQVQKRVGLTRIRRVIPVKRRYWCVEQRVIFRMTQGDLDYKLFHALELPAFTMGTPGAKENLACFPAIPAAEHGQA